MADLLNDRATQDLSTTILVWKSREALTAGGSLSDGVHEVHWCMSHYMGCAEVHRL